MGRVLGPFGVRGWVKIQPYTEQPDSLAQYPNWWVRIAQEWLEFQPEECEQHGQHLVARLRGFVDRDEVARFSGAEIAVSRDALPETGEGEFYRSDLIDLKVVNNEKTEKNILSYLNTSQKEKFQVLKEERAVGKNDKKKRKDKNNEKEVE